MTARTIHELETALRDWTMALPATPGGYRPVLGYDFLPGDLNDTRGVGLGGAPISGVAVGKNKDGSDVKIPAAQFPAVACHHIGDGNVERSRAGQTYRAQIVIELYAKFEDAQLAQQQQDELIQAIRDAANADSSLGGRVMDGVVGVVTRTPPLKWQGQLVRFASVRMDVFTTS